MKLSTIDEELTATFNVKFQTSFPFPKEHNVQENKEHRFNESKFVYETLNVKNRWKFRKIGENVV